MQSLFDFLGTPTESQGLGNQHFKRLPLDHFDPNEWQEKAAAFLKILSDCSPEAESKGFGHGMVGETEIVSSGMAANMPELKSPRCANGNPSEILQVFSNLPLTDEIANEISINCSLPEATDFNQNEQTDSDHPLTSLFLMFKHTLRPLVHANKDPVVDSETMDEAPDNPSAILSSSANVSDHPIPVSLPEQLKNVGENESTLQRGDETAVQQKTIGIMMDNSSASFRNVVSPSVPFASIETNERSGQTAPAKDVLGDSNLQNVGNSDNSDSIIELSEKDRGQDLSKSIQSSPALALSNAGEEAHMGKPILKEPATLSIDKGSEKESILNTKQDNGKNLNPIGISTSGQLDAIKEDEAQQSPIKTQLPGKESNSGQIPAHRAAPVKPSVTSTMINIESPDVMESSSEKGLGIKQNNNNSQTKYGNENENHDHKNPGTNKENGSTVIKDNGLPQKAVFQKFMDNNDTLKSEIITRSVSEKLSQEKQFLSTSNSSKQPEVNVTPPLNQSQSENRVVINTDIGQSPDVNANVEGNKDNSRVFAEKASTSQMDHVRTGSTAEERTDVIRQIVQHMNYRQFGSRSQMVVHLKPESLGQLRMQIETENQQVTVKMISDSTAVKEMIEQHLHTLKHELKEHGLEVHKIDVTVQSDSDQNRNGQPSGSFHQSAHQKESRQKRHQANQRGDQSENKSRSLTDTSQIDSSDQKNDRSEVDYFA